MANLFRLLIPFNPKFFLLFTLNLLLLFICSVNAGDSEPPVFISHGTGSGGKSCKDSDKKCSIWANEGECETNAAWMMANCRRSCQSCQGGERAWKLRNNISKSYDSNTTRANFTIHDVNVQSVHIDHLEINEQTQTAKIHGRLVMTWFDKKLKWNKDDWGISWLNFYWIQIWVPRIVQKNVIRGGDSSVVKWKTLAANYTGEVYMWAEFTLSAACDFDYSKYPADKQSCCFNLDDRRYFVVKFNVTENAQEKITESLENTHVAGWKLNSADIYTKNYRIPILRDWRRDPLDLHSTNFDICIKMERLTTYHSAEIVGPCVATAIVTLASFLVARFDQQIWMLIASIGLQILALQTLDAKLPPPTLGVPQVVRFYSVNLALTCLILIIIAILLILSSIQSSIPPPHCVEKAIDFVAKCCQCLIGGSNTGGGSGGKEGIEAAGDDNNNSNNSARLKQPWARFAFTIRCILFVVFLIVYILAMLSCLRA